MNREQRRQFVLDHRTAIFGYARAKDGPAMSIVYYTANADEILVSTMSDRAKAKAVARNPKVSLCVLDEQWPPSYLQVYCDAEIVTDFDLVVDTMMGIAGVMAGQPMSDDPWSKRELVRKSVSRCACVPTRRSIRHPGMSIRNPT